MASSFFISPPSVGIVIRKVALLTGPFILSLLGPVLGWAEKPLSLPDETKLINVRKELRELKRGRPVISSYITSSGSWTFTTGGAGIVWADGTISTSASGVNQSAIQINSPITGSGILGDPLGLNSSSVTLQGNLFKLVDLSSGVGMLASGYPFNAVCDGTTDDSLAIKNCVAVSSTTGVACVLPPRTCAFGSSSNPTSYLELRGGTLHGLTDHQGSDSVLIMNTYGGAASCGLASGGAVRIGKGNSNTVIRNLTIESGNQHTPCLINASGTGAGSSNQVGNFHMEKVDLYPHASSTGTIALVIGNNVRLRVVGNNYFAPGFKHAIKDLGTFTIASRIDSNTFDGPLVSSTDYKVILSGSSGLGEGIAGITVHNNIFQPDPRALQIAGAYGATVSDNWFGDVDVDADGAYLIDVDGVAINIRGNAINANDRNLGHLNAIRANGDSINITGNWIDAAWTAIEVIGDGHVVEGNDIFTPELAGIRISTGTSMKIGPNNTQIGGGGRKPFFCDDGASGNYIYGTLANVTGSSSCEDSNIVHNSTASFLSGYDDIYVNEYFEVGDGTLTVTQEGFVGFGTDDPVYPFHLVTSSTTGHQIVRRVEGAGGSVQGSIRDRWTYGGAGACMEMELNNLNAGNFRYGTYGDMNLRNCSDVNSGAYGNINLITNGTIRMTVGGGTDMDEVTIGSGTAPSSKWDVGDGFYGFNTLDPLYTLDVSGGARLTGQAVVQGTATVHGNAFSVGSSTFVVKNGHVGVRTTNPTAPFHVGSGGDLAASQANLVANEAGIAMVAARDSTADVEAVMRAKGSGVDFGSFTNNVFNLITNNATRVIVSSTGLVGVGNTNPRQKLHVGAGADASDMSASIHASEAGSTAISVRDSTNDVESYLLADIGGGRVGTVTNHAFDIRTNNTVRMQLDTSGNVVISNKLGLGTTPEASATKLHVAGSAGAMISYLTNTNTAGINYLVFNDVVGAGATPAVLSRYGSSHANAGRFEMMTFEAAPITLGTNGTVRVTIPTSGYSINTSSGIDVNGGGLVDLSGGSGILWPDGSRSTSAFSTPGSGTMNYNQSDGTYANNQGGIVYAKHMDGLATVSSGCVVAVQVESDAAGAVTTFTSTNTAGFGFSTNNARPGVLLESCTHPNVCRVGVKGMFRVLSQDTFNSSLPTTAGTRCQIQGAGGMGTNAIGWSVTKGGFTAGKWGFVMLQ